MKIRLVSFNTYLLLFLLSLTIACETTGDKKKKKDKEATTIRLHLETNNDGTKYNSGVPVYRQKPMLVNVVREPFLTEGDVEQAAVVQDGMGGFSIRLQFDRHGTFVLDSVTAANKGRRVAIFSQFGDARWLAAPKIPTRIQNGVLVFTPDASKEEAERIVKGLNNIAKELKKRSRF